MSNAPASLMSTRSQMAAITGSPLGDIGIAADTRHLSNGGYHCGAHDLKSINAVGNNDYSIRQTRDRRQYNADVAAGRNDASAMDYPDNWPHGGRAAWIRWNNLLRAQLGVRDPLLRAIRGINFTPDGTRRRRFDCVTMTETASTDTVDSHTHIEWWRDTIADVAARYDATRRLCELARAAIANVSPPTTPPTTLEATMSSEATFFAAVDDPQPVDPVFYGIPGVSCIWVKPPTPGGDYRQGDVYKSINGLISSKWIEPPYQVVNHTPGAAPGVDRALIRISGEIPPGYEACALLPAQNTVVDVDVNAVVEALVANPAFGKLIYNQAFAAAQAAEDA